jgi:hypothetical protein
MIAPAKRFRGPLPAVSLKQAGEAAVACNPFRHPENISMPQAQASPFTIDMPDIPCER